MFVEPTMLRVGVLLDSLTVPDWIYSILEEIQQGSDARIDLVVLNGARHERRFVDRLRALPVIPFYAYSKLDARLFGRSGASDAFVPRDAVSLLKGIPQMSVIPLEKRWSDRFPKDDVEKIRDLNLDLILRFGFRILKGEILGAARHGVWSFHHGDNRRYRGGPALFWEIAEGNPSSGTLLQILNENLDAGSVIYRSTSATQFASLFRNRNETYWKTARFVGRCLRELRRQGKLAIENVNASELGKIYRVPRPAALAKFLCRITAENVRQQIAYRLQRDQWFLAVAPRPQRIIGSRPRFHIVEPPPDRFYADPFVAEEGGRAFVFFEDYRYEMSRGVISCAPLEEGRLGPVTVILSRDYHLSYPAVFDWQGQWYMTPETSQNGTIELYRATSFPYQWELERVLIDGVTAVDPTLFYHDGTLWLFATVIAPGASSRDEVSLFFSKRLEGPWHAHPMNPIVSDARSARPAGFPFFDRDALYRPGQDCTVRYGRAIAINRVEVLTESDYKETKIGSVEPEWLPKSICTHTLSLSKHWLVTDGMRRKWKPPLAKHSIAGR
ncbi:MAG TPA: hypothetical protein VLV86_25355 [Vicinamibacterales bacterium]|nr:hypothetical protein [Vicinamibacterales bacterium]